MPVATPSRRFLVLLAAALAVGVAGLYFGQAARRFWSAPSATGTSLLVEGASFPEVALLDEDGAVHSTGDLLAGEGAVVVFLDPDCPPCGRMAVLWQAALDAGLVPDLRVLGIAAAAPESVRTFKEENGVAFPIYLDDGGVFLASYRVTRFPFRVVVGRSGRVEAVSQDSDELPPAAALEVLLQR